MVENYFKLEDLFPSWPSKQQSTPSTAEANSSASVQVSITLACTLHMLCMHMTITLHARYVRHVATNQIAFRSTVHGREQPSRHRERRSRRPGEAGTTSATQEYHGHVCQFIDAPVAFVAATRAHV